MRGLFTIMKNSIPQNIIYNISRIKFSLVRFEESIFKTLAIEAKQSAKVIISIVNNTKNALSPNYSFSYLASRFES